MERKDAVRILELIENLNLEQNPDEHFMLKEYLKYIGENRIATGYAFPIQALRDKTRTNRFNGQISNTELAINKANEDTTYKFRFKNGCNLLSSKASNNICNLEVIIPREIQVKHANDPQLIDFEEYLDTTAIIVRKKAFKNHMSLQKRNQYIKKGVAIVVSVAVLGAATFVAASYIGEQQEAQRQLYYQNQNEVEQNVPQIPPELEQQQQQLRQMQQQYQDDLLRHQMDPEEEKFSKYLESIREEHEAEKKLQ